MKEVDLEQQDQLVTGTVQKR